MKSKWLVGTGLLSVWMSACQGPGSLGDVDAGEAGAIEAGAGDAGQSATTGGALDSGLVSTAGDAGASSTGSLDVGLSNSDASVDSGTTYSSEDSGTPDSRTPDGATSASVTDGGEYDANVETETNETPRTDDVADAATTGDAHNGSTSSATETATDTLETSLEPSADAGTSSTNDSEGSSVDEQSQTHTGSASGGSTATGEASSSSDTSTQPTQGSSDTESFAGPDGGASEQDEQTSGITETAFTSDATSSVVVDTDASTVDSLPDAGDADVSEPDAGPVSDASSSDGAVYDASVEVSSGDEDAADDAGIDAASATEGSDEAGTQNVDSGVEVTSVDGSDGETTFDAGADAAASESTTTDATSSTTDVTVGVNVDAGDAGEDSGAGDATSDASGEEGAADAGSNDAGVTAIDDAASDAAGATTGESSEVPSSDSGVSESDDAGASGSTDSGSTEVPALDGRQLFEEEQFGGNGRTCSTCHTAATGTITPEQIQDLYETDPTDPMFRSIDSNDGVGSDYSQLLARATFRVEIDLPSGVTLASDPTVTSVVFRRSVPSTINTPGLDPTLMWDGRAEDLLEQATGAIMGHAEATVAPTTEQLELIAEFEQTDPFFSSDVLRDYYQGGPAPQWPPGSTAAEQRGRRWFAEDRVNAPRFNICGQCHGGPMTNETQQNSGLPVGEHFQTANVSEFNTKGNPTYQFVFPDPRRPGRTLTVTTPDPGLALTTGDARDVNFFKIPTLWGVSKTAPYFHDNSALTLEELMDHYERHLATFLRRGPNYPTPHVPTAQDKADIIAYLKLL